MKPALRIAPDPEQEIAEHYTCERRLREAIEEMDRHEREARRLRSVVSGLLRKRAKDQGVAFIRIETARKELGG